MNRTLHIVTFLVFVATAIGLAGFAAWRDRQQTVAAARQQLESTAHMLAEHAGRTIEAGDSVLLNVQDLASRWDFSDPEGGGRIHRVMARQVKRLPQITSVWLIVAATGESVVDSWSYPAAASVGAIRERSYFRAHATPGGPDLFIGDPRPGTISGKHRFVLSRAIRAPDGRLRAVATTGVFSHYFVEVFRESRLPAGSRFVLTTDDGTVLARDPEAPPARGEVMVVEHRVDGLPLTVTVAVPEDAVLRDWMWRTNGVIWVVIGALAGFWFLVSLSLRSARAEEEAKRGLEAEVARRTRELRDALARAQEANDAKLKFIAEVSHDLRQPLQGTSLFIDVALANATDPRLVRLGEMCVDNLEFGRRLLDELLTFAKLDAGVVAADTTELPLGPILDCVAESIRAQAERKGLEVRVVPTRQWVASDPARLRQMIENLAVNAVKFTACGRILIGCRRRGDHLEIEVWDTGIGIPSDHLDSIFREFHQVAPGTPAEGSGKGVGLGLSIVERSARLLGHAVSVRSWPGRGTVFAVTVPRVDVAQSSVEPAAVCR